MSRCELTKEVFQALGSILMSGVSKLVRLSVGLNDVGDTAAKHIWEALRHKHCKLQHLEWVKPSHVLTGATSMIRDRLKQLKRTWRLNRACLVLFLQSGDVVAHRRLRWGVMWICCCQQHFINSHSKEQQIDWLLRTTFGQINAGPSSNDRAKVSSVQKCTYS